ncbi:MAG: hypothetical protein HZB42_03190 [Sphingobacteriales bacterium]|nr:hypothetical protein [Sphingobacteriales bacterium]
MLTEKEKVQLADYEEQMATPPVKFIIIYGVLAWGILMGLLVSLLNWLTGEYTLLQLIRKNLWVNLGTFMIGGILFGYLMRRIIARQIKRLKKKESVA